MNWESKRGDRRLTQTQRKRESDVEQTWYMGAAHSIHVRKHQERSCRSWQKLRTIQRRWFVHIAETKHQIHANDKAQNERWDETNQW
jgi:hypothetical protein